MINEPTNGNGENKIRKVLFNEVSFVISICAVIIGVVLFITRPDAQMQQDIALIKQSVDTIQKNELQHITTRDEQQRQISEILQAIAAMRALLEQHLNER